MERKIIGLNKGIHRSPTSGEPGELMECMNLVVRNGEIMNAPVLKEVGMTFPTGYKLVFVHKTSNGKVYVLLHDSKLYYMREGETTLAYTEMSAQEKNQKYLEIVGEVDTQIKSLELYIVGLEQTIARLKEESQKITLSEAQAKMQTFITSVETLGFSRMLRDYDSLYHTNYLSQWNAASLSGKYYMLAYGNYESIANSIVGELRKSVYTTHLIYQTNLGNYYCYEMRDLSAHVPERIFSKMSKITITSGGSTWEEYECVYGDNGNLVNTMADGEYVEDFSSGYIHKDYIYYDYDGYKNFPNLYNQIDCDAYYDYYVALNADPTTIANKEAELTTKQQQLATLKSGTYAEKLAEYNQAIQSNRNYFCEGVVLKDITAIGNTLVVVAENARIFVLYQNNKYKSLGDHLPECELQFALKIVDSSENRVKGDSITIPGGKYKCVDTEFTNGRIITTRDSSGGDSTSDLKVEILGAMDKIIGETKNLGYFIAPFSVRYAYRLYDGSHYMASSPVIMIPDSGIVPYAIISGEITKEQRTNYLNEFTIGITSNQFHLQMRNLSRNIEDTLSDWGDVVVGIDVFVSEQFMRYDSGGKYWGKHFHYSEDRLFIAARPSDNTKGFYEDYSKTYGIYYNNESRRSGFIGGYYEFEATHDNVYFVAVPQKSSDDFEKEVCENSLFYKVSEYKINDLPTELENVKIEEGVLSGLKGRETLSYEKDYMSHDSFVPSRVYVMNNRLHQANFSRILFKGFAPVPTHCYYEGKHLVESLGPVSDAKINMSFNVWIKEQDRYLRLESNGSESISNKFGKGFFYFYPNSNAKQLEVQYGSKKYYLKMKPCEFMNGSYAFVGFNKTIDECAITNSLESQGENLFYYKNRIYSSEVNNPFVVSLDGMNNVGNGEIYEIASTSKALSQGQFGSFPLLAFANDGIWALTQNDEGLFSAVQPLSREVLINNTKVCQTDSNIIFASASGINMLNGSDVVCISDALDGIKDMDNKFITSSSMSGWASLAKVEEDSFDDVIQNAQFVYDSANYMLHLYTSDTSVHYVCDLKTMEWTRMQGGKPTSIVMGYPYTYIQDGTKLYRYRGMSEVTKQSTTKRKGLLLTREMSFDNPVAMKMLHDLRVLRKQQSSTTKVVVWVSDDREHWKQLGSLKHSSWKWYRFALYTDMTDVEGIEGIVCDVEERRTNKLR